MKNDASARNIELSYVRGFSLIFLDQGSLQRGQGVLVYSNVLLFQ